ncbi:cobalt-zinc-cadmium resistance protein [Cupriavidus gilardii]|uniref:cobalt-zinc-cadmium resistance protein n=1 Tax=Cupriavidus gilardii TaxID=82541 RepID=UPI001571F383|nr:cobalt-zinc-cadmium resistance protein [Cupriavidus gilardii]MCG5260517.1 cobalt-zinc-cadmium resistance protein [Cupriavidus gilardii]MDF9428365.1 cobalt-zinc-cadmium resistance protein [Cupriavidus gilardii]NSX03162.1 cobalt-zinc-cadmium resistance protein [Cupriavidus gilardii]
MRRFFLILLVMLLPLQSVWAAATAYCQHEQRPTAQWHLGHHQHQHRADGKAEVEAEFEAEVEPYKADTRQVDIKADAEHDTDANGLFDPDCGTCHLASLPFARPDATGMPVLRLPRTVLLTHDFHYSSLHPRAPDRPQWLRLA